MLKRLIEVKAKVKDMDRTPDDKEVMLHALELALDEEERFMNMAMEYKLRTLWV